MAAASQLITVGTVQVLSVRTPQGHAPEASIREFHRALLAIERHVRTVVGHPHHALPPEISKASTAEGGALRQYLSELRSSADRVPQRDATAERELNAWGRGARVLGAATDLLGTYFDDAGRARSPDSEELEDPRRVMAALVQAAELTRTLLAAHPHLALLAGHAGQPWSEVARELPLQTGLTEAVEDVYRTYPGPVPSTGWEHMTVAHPGLDRGDPWTQFAGRLHHLRHVAWQLAQHPRADLRELDAIAASAVIVLRGAHSWAQDGHASAIPDDHWLARAERGISGWSEVRLSLREIRSVPGPRLAPLINPRAFDDVTRAMATHPSDHSALAVWQLGFDTLGEVAARNQATITEMARGGLLSIRGRFLRGDDITDYPGLVEAKLRDSLAPVPPAHLARIGAAYASAVSPGAVVTGRPSASAVRHRHDRVIAR